MDITCPQCNFSRSVDPAKLPDRPVRVNCPKCSKGFAFDKSAHLASKREQVACPTCGLVQDMASSCRGCGVIYAKLPAGRAKADPLFDNLAALRRHAVESPAQLPKAGFWIRAVAFLLDSLLLLAVETALSLLIGLTIGWLGVAGDGDPAIDLVIWLFGVTLSIGYAVFFTGYCGQTPGKMALRIKVIRTNGRPLTYGRAALREFPGKLISSLLLGVGYLMVAFDSQKQGLHDRIADTYVIKL